MSDNYNNNQITRKDAKNCFVESLNDSFSIGKIHFAFATYDVSKPVGQRQTNNIHIYIDVDEFLEVELIPLRDLVKQVLAGQIPDAKTQLAILKAAAHEGML